MEKLIQYLNQHRIELCNGNTTNLIKFKYSHYTFNLGDLGEQNTELLVISKQYGFIKWLVDNKKIDRDRVREIDISISFHDEYDGFYSDDEKELLMLLAIQDEPIKFLVSILK